MSVVQRYAFAEESNVYLILSKQLCNLIFQATTKISNINTSFKDLPHTVARS